MAIFVPLLAAMRPFVGGVGLLLAVQWCSSAPPPSLLTAPKPVRALPPTTAPAVPVAPLIRALLDTAAGPARAADARLGLRAGSDVRTFYGSTFAPAWTQPTDSLNPDASAALGLLARAPAHGLRPTDYGWPRLQALRDSLRQPAGPALAEARARQQARLEVYLTDAVLRFMRDLSRGRLRPYTLSGREKAAGRAWQPALGLRAALGHGAVPATMLAGQPPNREYRELQRALAQWLTRPVPPDSGRQHEARYQQAALNLERWRWDAIADSEYLLINIPAYELQVVAHDSVLHRRPVVVGKPKTPTPTLSSAIGYFTLAPDWHVPRSIATKEILPRLKVSPGYLARNNYTLYDERGRLLDPYRINWRRVTAQNFRYVIRQSAGCENALGNIVFRFENPYSVYLHDTPTRQLFAQPERALSHGCIRLEQPMQLAALLLRRDGQPLRLPSEEECARQPRPRDVRLRRPIALHVRYATCIGENGHLRFLPDIYQRDEVIRRGLFGARR
ncbi:Murein L,D-transpeptidase YcbB/YkuD [Hymenobacter daecheongensis DSM 21074]|uniref:Murein L,D-transpeptidase YcbB/YkuD n=1 Tax=Hymenobacter daecheongensis DSM 21074 TaxID=1121955 RepID=A0A1M6ME16_9BACT|nr:L,D-transpeptidase family protein [Hymenobacter daecheongensis]SHJ81689.1 Murein L,D-transpeptidase YcbB/YkuD [Hymenobacter daecheongensis DSM 21074]